MIMLVLIIMIDIDDDCHLPVPQVDEEVRNAGDAQ